jgi:diphosphomevalonate decarboxylase
MQNIREAMVKANTNIALIKYWGKMQLYEYLHFPTKSSLSLTANNLYVKTKMRAKKGNGNINIKFSGKKEHDKNIIEYFEKLFNIFPLLKKFDFSINTKGNFPKAAGFASSAAGFAALAHCIAKCFPELNLNERKITAIARIGSGSAARSATFNGGVVIWKRPKTLKENPFISYAETLFKAEMFKELRLIYVSISEKEKKVKSRAGMKQSVETCPFYWHWVNYEEKILLPNLIKSLNKKEYEKAFDMIIEASNNFHSICLSTKPCINYLNDDSFRIINLINEINEKKKKAAYTFDAGCNPVLITKALYVNDILDKLKNIKKAKILSIQKIGKGITYL